VIVIHLARREFHHPLSGRDKPRHRKSIGDEKPEMKVPQIRQGRERARYGNERPELLEKLPGAFCRDPLSPHADGSGIYQFSRVRGMKHATGPAGLPTVTVLRKQSSLHPHSTTACRPGPRERTLFPSIVGLGSRRLVPLGPIERDSLDGSVTPSQPAVARCHRTGWWS